MPDVKLGIAALLVAATACSHAPAVRPTDPVPVPPPSPLRIGVHVAELKDRSVPLRIETDPLPEAASAEPDGAVLRQTIPDEVNEFLTLSARYDRATSADDCDLLLVGIIQSAAEGHAEIDLRLVSCVTHISVAATHASLAYDLRRGALRPTVASLSDALRDLSGQVPDVQLLRKGRVTALDGEDVTVAIEGDIHAALGMPALAVRYEVAPKDPAAPGLLGGEKIAGRLYVRDVAAGVVHARVVPGGDQAAAIAVGDFVIFK